MKSIYQKLQIIIIGLLLFSSCNTILRSSEQSIKIRSNIDSIIVLKDSKKLKVNNLSLKVPRDENVVLLVNKEGYESQTIMLTKQRSYLPVNLIGGLGFAFLPGLLLSGDPSSYAGIALTTFIGFSTIGGMIDIASGARYIQYPEEVKVNLYPTLQNKIIPNLSIVCNDFYISESKFLNSIGNRNLFIQWQSVPILLTDNKLLTGSVSKDIINEYLADLGCNVPGKMFNVDTTTNFVIEAIVDSIGLNDMLIKRNDIIEIDNKNNSGEVIHDFTEKYVYTELKMSIIWRLTNKITTKSIQKSVNTNIYYYGESLKSAYVKHLRTSFNQLLNDAEVQALLAQ